MAEKDIRTGVACLKAKPGVKGFRRFGNGKGAYVNVVAWANSKQGFENHVRQRADELDCVLVETEGVQLLESKINSQDCPDELITMRDTVHRQPSDTVFGTFHIWDRDESN